MSTLTIVFGSSDDENSRNLVVAELGLAPPGLEPRPLHGHLPLVVEVAEKALEFESGQFVILRRHAVSNT